MSPVCIAAEKSEKLKVKDAYQALQKAEILSTEPGPQILSFDDHKIELDIPKNYVLKKMNMAQKVIYAISGPSDSAGGSPDLMIYFVPPPGGASLPPSRVIFDAMLTPFRQRMSDYYEESKEPIKIDGKYVENAFYRGTMAGREVKGFVFVARLKFAFCVFTGTDSAIGFQTSETPMLDAVKSTKVIH